MEDLFEDESESPLPSACVAVKMEVKGDKESDEEQIENEDNYDEPAAFEITDESSHCHKCNVTFTNSRAWGTHLESCSADNSKRERFFCNICGVRVSSASYLQAHKGAVHRKGEPVAPLPSACVAVKMEIKGDEESDEEQIENEDYYDEQAADEVVDEPSLCTKCNNTFANTHAFAAHVESCNADNSKRKKHFCDLCGVKVSSVSYLRVHKGAVHLKEKPYGCTLCDASFSYKSSLSRHVRYHTGDRPYRCDLCPSAFMCSKDLQTHKRYHTGEKRYHCDECDHSFVTSSDLKVHQRRHTGECPYVCSWCGVGFPIRTRMTLHVRRHHTNEKPYICKECSAGFASNCALKEHERIHTGERPFRCEYCGVSYSGRSNLRVHLRKHTGERPFACEVCKATFTSRYSLRLHAATHSESRPFSCRICSAAFKTRTGLNKHHNICKYNEDLYRCDICGKSFTTKEAIQKHIINHSNSTRKRVVCKKVCAADEDLPKPVEVLIKTENDFELEGSENNNNDFEDSNQEEISNDMKFDDEEHPNGNSVCRNDVETRT